MSNLEMLRDFIAQCPLIGILSNDIHIDWTDQENDNYGIMPTGISDKIINQYVDGSKRIERQESYSLYIRKFTFDDIQRLQCSNFTSDLQSYFSKEYYDDKLPFTEDEARLEVASNGLFELDVDAQIGTYMIQINLFYEKEV